MKMHELSAGVRTPVSNEENLLMRKIYRHKNLMRRRRLDEREIELANQLVRRGVLTRTQKDGKLYYSVDTSDPIWRI